MHCHTVHSSTCCRDSAHVRTVARTPHPVACLAAASVPDSHARRNEAGPSAASEAAEIPSHVIERNNAFAQQLRGKLVLAPLTRGGNLPFRRLCVSLGAEATMSEMAFARGLIKGDRVERARLYKAANEACFGVQIATKAIHEGVAAAKLAAEAGASWIDLNCGCPIYEATRRGCGAALLRKPAKLARLVAGIAADSPLPLTVKIRTGESEKKINAPQVVEMLGAAGAAAVTVHGRTTEQRYRKAADWDLIGQLSRDYEVPVIGNGDILTHYEMADRQQQQQGCLALMVGRGALIKPWIFQEAKEGRELLLTAADRIGVYRELVSYMKEHFRDDAIGKRRAFYFLPWHFAFFHRYRHLPAEVYQEASRQHPLIATRFDVVDEQLCETLEDLPLLERLLRCESEAAHAVIADTLWEAASDAEAVKQLEGVAAQQLAGWEEEVRDLHSRGASSADETAVEG